MADGSLSSTRCRISAGAGHRRAADHRAAERLDGPMDPTAVRRSKSIVRIGGSRARRTGAGRALARLSYEAALQAERKQHAARRKLRARSSSARCRPDDRRAARPKWRQIWLVDMSPRPVARIVGGVLSEDSCRSARSTASRIDPRQAIADRETIRIEVRGPQSLFEALAARPARPGRGSLDYVEATGFDLTVTHRRQPVRDAAVRMVGGAGGDPDVSSPTGRRRQAHEIIIVRHGHGDHDDGHHGGAWKIAFADFMTAMMCFFLVMWLINASNEQTKASVASYFNPVKLIDRNASRKGLEDVGDGPQFRRATEAGQPVGRSRAAAATAGKSTHEGSSETKSESTVADEKLFADPYAVLAEIAADTGKQQNIRDAGAGGAQDAGPATGASGGEAYRDPFAPDFWSQQVRHCRARARSRARNPQAGGPDPRPAEEMAEQRRRPRTPSPTRRSRPTPEARRGGAGESRSSRRRARTRLPPTRPAEKPAKAEKARTSRSPSAATIKAADEIRQELAEGALPPRRRCSKDGISVVADRQGRAHVGDRPARLRHVRDRLGRAGARDGAGDGEDRPHDRRPEGHGNDQRPHRRAGRSRAKTTTTGACRPRARTRPTTCWCAAASTRSASQRSRALPTGS